MSSAIEAVRELLRPEVERPEIRRVRERVLLALLTILAASGFVPITVGVLTAVEQGQRLFPVLYVVLYAALVVLIFARRRIAYAVRGGILVALGVAFSLVVLVRLGLSGLGIELLTTFVVGATVLFGTRASLRLLIFGLVSIAAIGTGIVTGAIPIDSELLLTSYMGLPWLNAGLVFVLMTVIMALGPQVLLRRLSQLVDERERDAADLIAANEQLRAAVDERQRAEAARQQSEERYQNLVDILPEAVFETDASGKFSYVNQRAFDVFGFDRSDLGEVSALDVLVEKERAMTNIMRAAAGEELGLTEYTAMRKDGSRFPVLVRSTPIREGDAISGLRGLVIDVTERKRLEEQLNQAQKMEAVGTLAGGLAHDFNNLLMAIQGRVSLMLTDIVADPREHLLAIEEYVRSASELTNRLLGVARGGKYEVAPADINELVRDSLSLFGRTRKDLRTHIDYLAEVSVAEVDRRQVEQVLLNLWVNAWQAMPNGGELHVKTGIVELGTETAAMYDVQPGAFVSIRVRDTGIGMSDEVRERVFEPFFTTKEMGRGTGLGLASAYGIVRNHGGCITVESVPGEGSTFTVLLPRVSGTVERRSSARPDVKGGRGTVLLIDDENIVREVCASLLERLGYEVVQAGTGQEAIELFRKGPKQFDLVILDLVMPAQQGAEVFDALVATRSDVRILIASGYSIDGDASALLERGAVGFLQKPFSLEQLAAKLQEVFA